MELFPYQQEDVERVVAMHGRALLALDMGLGKTAIAIRAAVLLNAFPWTIICPAVLRLNWLEELRTWAPELLRDPGVSVVISGKDPIGPITVVSYELAAR